MRRKELQTKLLEKPISVRLADGRTVDIFEILPQVRVIVSADSSSSQVETDFLLVKNLKYPLILGIPWLKSANPKIDWSKKTLEFNFGRTQGDLIVKERLFFYI